MKTVLRGGVAGAITALMLSGTEAVVGYPRPSSASAAFFAAAFMTYLPLAVITAWILMSVFPKRGLDFCLPFLAGMLRLGPPLAAAVFAGHRAALVLTFVAVAVVLALRSATESRTQSPPFLFGLTVGMVLPILAGRMASLTVVTSLIGPEIAVPLGVVAGLLMFVFLRALVARWPRVAPVFVLGPVVSLAVWARQGPPPLPMALAPPMPAVAHRPDIVLVVLDTVRAQALASYGSGRDTMPNLEAFARGSTTFLRAWTEASWTLPAHAALFSGLRVTKHRYDSGFDAFERTSPDLFLAPRLRRAGYATGAVAANFGVFGREDPLLRGFEHIDAEPLRPFAFHPWFFDLLAAFPRAPGLHELTSKFPGPSMRAPWVVDRALEFWRHSDGRPRFLFVNLMEAHLPWVPEAADVGRFGPSGLATESEQVSVLGRYLKDGRPTAAETEMLRNRYDEALYSLDRSVGRLLEGIESAADSAGTIVVITADHGESLGEHDRFGHRNSLDEEATRIPLIVRGPGFLAGERRDEPVQLVDVFGYLAQAAGIALEPALDARKFGERRAVVIEHRPGPQGALPSSYPRGDLSAVIIWPFKYVEGTNVGASLFDLAQDPKESKDLVVGEAAQAKLMSLLLKELSGRPSGPSPAPDPAMEERLRALGYVR